MDDSQSKELIDEVLRLPGDASAALVVLQVVDDPAASAEDVGRALLVDQALSTRAVYIANSAFYGRVSEVAGPGEAAAVLGFDTVRSLAAGVAFGLLDTGSALPDEYRYHSALAASAATVLARRLLLPVGDAFSLALLHDLGMALLALRRPIESSRIRAQALASGTPVEQLELAEFGINHATLGALAMRATRFPQTYVQVAMSHHRAIDDDTPIMVRLVMAADGIAHFVDNRWPGSTDHLVPTLASLGLAGHEQDLIEETIGGIAEVRALTG